MKNYRMVDVSPLNPGPKATRAAFVPRRVIIWLCVGIVGVTAVGPIAFMFDIFFWIAGDQWLNLVFPVGVIGFSLFATANILLLSKLAFRSNVTYLKGFWAHAIVLIVAFFAIYGINIVLMARSPNRDIFSFYLVITIYLTAALPLAIIFAATLYRNKKWFSQKYWQRAYSA